MVQSFDGEANVAYYQFHLETPEVIPGEDVGRRFAGQTNGLCGVGELGMLLCASPRTRSMGSGHERPQHR